jgi:hypothetical protein
MFDRRSAGSIEIPLIGRHFIRRTSRVVEIGPRRDNFIRLLAGMIFIAATTNLSSA